MTSHPDPSFDIIDRRATNRVRAQLERARSAGGWMPVAGLLLALLFWGGTGAWLYTTMGVEALLAQPPLMLAAGGAALLTPGLALVCAGVMARESRRSSEANAIVLTSARLLLEPADHARGQIATIAEAVTAETQQVNKALAETRSRMDALKTDIEASVTAALKAAEIVRTDSEVLVSKMNSERQNLTQLAEAIRNQAESLAKAIPRHAQLMSEATRAAQEEVRRADETMEQRLRGIEDTARRLADRINQLDTMGAESRKRAQNLAGALMRLDEQLVQSTRMVDAAMSAGEMATAAAKNTADSLRDAMSDALDSALKAAETINARSAAASQEAREAMVMLQEAGLQAETTTRAAAMAARAHAAETEQRINTLSDQISRASVKSASAAEGGADRDSLLLEEPVEATPADFIRAGLQKPTAHADMETAQRTAAHADPAPAEPPRPLARETAAETAPAGAGNSRLSWRDLLTSLDEPPGGKVTEDISSNVIERLDRAGVRLSVVKASDLRRIASAAHQGERQRRRAIRDVAPGEIQRVSRLLDADHELQSAARSFLASEEPEALRSLASAERARDDAAPRLSAYLLLDAALGSASL